MAQSGLARLTGGQKVAGSNPVAPTLKRRSSLNVEIGKPRRISSDEVFLFLGTANAARGGRFGERERDFKPL